jgi:hypothetical protein
MMTGGMKEAKMTLGARGVLGLALLMATAGAAQAECLSAKCSNQITIFLFMVAGFVLLAIVIVVMLFRPNWRKEGVILLALSVAVFAGIPLASQGWMALKRAAMERREVVGQPPTMTGRTPLVITQDWDCKRSHCKSVLLGRGLAGAYVVTQSSLKEFDPGRPIPLADLPLTFQSYVQLGDNRVSRVLTEAERREAALRIDYIIMLGPVLEGYRYDPTKLNTTGAIDHLLRDNPGLDGQTAREFVQLAMAPTEPGSGTLSFADLRFDLLELWFFGNALALPLAPDHWRPMANTRVSAAAAAASLCPVVDGEADWFCVTALQ